VSNAIGIDPDSTGVVCALVNGQSPQVVTKSFMATEEGMKELLKWVGQQGQVLLAIEGSHGQSQPIEKAFREGGLLLHSFRPADTDKFRKAVLGQNKDNQRDAESVARYALALESQGRLERYRRVWFPEIELQLLTRRLRNLSGQITAEVNRLWKLLRYTSVDLYLALGGRNPDVDCGEQKALKNQGILTLLIHQPDIGAWKNLDDPQILQAMGGGAYKGRLQLITSLRTLMPRLPSLSPSMALLLKSSAQQIQRLRDESTDLKRVLEDLTRERLPIQALTRLRGFGIPTAATIIAEIIDVRRFSRQDSLACYSGLGMKEHSTGQTVRMVPSLQFNHRLKDAFMTAALNYVRYNPDSHIAGYHRNLIKKGMSNIQATKRVARALVRVVYRILVGLAVDTQTDTEEKGGESEAASGQRRSDECRRSNTPLSTPTITKAKKEAEVKVTASQTASARVRRPRRTIPKKIA
jgi:transposase